MTKKTLPFFFALAMAYGLSGPALGEGESALKGHDPDQPIDIVADRLEVNQEQHLAVFEGKVEAVQGELKFMTETLRVYYETGAGNKDPKIARLDASGRVRLESPAESAEGNWAVYDVKSRTITLLGDVVLRREESEFKGERLEIDLDSGVTKFDGEPLDLTTGQAGRVKGRFSLPEDSK